MQKKIHLICAARPNFMKVAPLWKALKNESWAHPKLIHTGQHYDYNMSGTFFAELGLPSPDYHLEVGSGSHAVQTGQTMIAYEKIAIDDKPDLVIVVGDVNATAACAQVGAKLRIPVAHLEAGLRSGDRDMPEEINRLITDTISDLLWTPSSDGDENLIKEGISSSKIVRVGNIMIDSLEMMRESIEKTDSVKTYGVEQEDYALVTIHRPSNTSDKEQLEKIVLSLIECSKMCPLLFPIHPRTKKMIYDFGLSSLIEEAKSLTLLDPLPYLDFMSFLFSAKAMITDSGGVQEETTYLGIPCLTLRDNTERPITVTHGTNQLVNVANLSDKFAAALKQGRKNTPCAIEFWDGKTAERVVQSIKDFL